MNYATLGVIVPLVSALIFSVPALAADAIVISIKFGSIPSGAQIEVRSFDDSDANMALKADFSKALARSADSRGRFSSSSGYDRRGCFRCVGHMETAQTGQLSQSCAVSAVRIIDGCLYGLAHSVRPVPG